MTESILHNFDEHVEQKPRFNPLVIFLIVAVIAGIISGKIISGSAPVKQQQLHRAVCKFNKQEVNNLWAIDPKQIQIALKEN